MKGVTGSSILLHTRMRREWLDTAPIEYGDRYLEFGSLDAPSHLLSGSQIWFRFDNVGWVTPRMWLRAGHWE